MQSYQIATADLSGILQSLPAEARRPDADIVYVPLDDDGGTVEVPDAWIEAWDAAIAVPAEVRAEAAVERAKADAIARVRAYASEQRGRLCGAADPYKAAVYNQRAAYGRMILAGTASEAMLAVARSECLRLAAIDKADAVAKGLVDAAGVNPDPVAIAVVWQAMDEHLALLSAELDMTEAETIAAIERRRTVAGVDEALATAKVAAEARVAEIMAGQA